MVSKLELPGMRAKSVGYFMKVCKAHRSTGTKPAVMGGHSRTYRIILFFAKVRWIRGFPKVPTLLTERQRTTDKKARAAKTGAKYFDSKRLGTIAQS